MKNVSIQCAVLIFFVSFYGCDQVPSESVTNNYYTVIGDSLRDPSVMPKIVFTNPVNGSTGPFNNPDPTQSSKSSRITIQLNKLINILDLNSSTVTLRSNNVINPIMFADFVYTSGNGYQYQDPYVRNILIYTVQDKYLAGRTYTLTIDTTLADVHGNRLSKPYSISFVPEPSFRVYNVSPTGNTVEADSYYPSDYSSKISVMFNSKLDSSILNKFTITPPVPGNWSLSNNYYNDSTMVIFNQLIPFTYNTKYTVSVSGTSTDANDLMIKSPYQFSFTTVPFSVQLNSYSIGQGPGGFNVMNNLGFQFNGPVDTSTVRSAIVVTPSIAYTLSFYTNRSIYQYSGVRVNFNEQQFLPNTTYTITVKPNVKSMMGDGMKDQYTYSYTTGHN